VFSDGKIIDEVLKQRLENKVYAWFKEMKTMVALKPDVILEKNPAASPAQCIRAKLKNIFELYFVKFSY